VAVGDGLGVEEPVAEGLGVSLTSRGVGVADEALPSTPSPGVWSVRSDTGSGGLSRCETPMATLVPSTTMARPAIVWPDTRIARSELAPSTAHNGGIDEPSIAMARIESTAAANRMQASQLAACMARSRGGSPSAPAVSQSLNRS
jgi:hypothetical protein